MHIKPTEMGPGVTYIKKEADDRDGSLCYDGFGLNTISKQPVLEFDGKDYKINGRVNAFALGSKDAVEITEDPTNGISIDEADGLCAVIYDHHLAKNESMIMVRSEDSPVKLYREGEEHTVEDTIELWDSDVIEIEGKQFTFHYRDPNSNFGEEAATNTSPGSMRRYIGTDMEDRNVTYIHADCAIKVYSELMAYASILRRLGDREFKLEIADKRTGEPTETPVIDILEGMAEQELAFAQYTLAANSNRISGRDLTSMIKRDERLAGFPHITHASKDHYQDALSNKDTETPNLSNKELMDNLNHLLYYNKEGLANQLINATQDRKSASAEKEKEMLESEFYTKGYQKCIDFIRKFDKGFAHDLEISLEDSEKGRRDTSTSYVPGLKPDFSFNQSLGSRISKAFMRFLGH